MSYDDWKCSPPCPTCGTPNCICDEPEDEGEPEVCTFSLDALDFDPFCECSNCKAIIR